MSALFSFFASLFGYVLNFLYELIHNYGLAIILFTILIKLIMLPLSIRQQKTLKKNAKIQEKIKTIQFKYKNDQEKINQEVMSLYKDEKMSPFSGCLTTLVQFVLLLSIFYVVRSPLTYMKHIDNFYVNKDETIENVQALDITQSAEKNDDTLPLIQYYEGKIEENENMKKGNYQEISVINYFGQNDEKIKINMSFLGLDLGQIPQQNLTDFRVWIIPVLYIISSFISIRLTTKLQENNNKKKDKLIESKEDKKEKKDKEEKDETDTMMQTSKIMNWMMPILSISIAIIAPLGLALYWFVNNLLMIGERIVLDKVIKTEEEK